MNELVRLTIIAAARQLRLKHLYGGRHGFKVWDAAYTISEMSDPPSRDDGMGAFSGD